MESFLILGFFVGMAHALEADHLAAVGALAADGKTTPNRLAFLGASWAMGHSTTLLLISLPVIVFGVLLSEKLVAGMEFAVGAMLVVLGAQVLWKLRRQRVRFNLHVHADGQKHLHAVGHRLENHTHDKKPQHCFRAYFSLRAYLVGLAHGAAGSAGLVALTAIATQNMATALFYVFVFGIGSFLGMAVLTYSVGWPLRFMEKSAAKVIKVVQICVAALAIFIGTSVMAGMATLLIGAT